MITESGEHVWEDLPGDWTHVVHGDSVRSNSSVDYLLLVDAVEKLIREGGGSTCLDQRWIRGKAALIVSQLAFVHDVGPLGPYRTEGRKK